jgi:hypothetical protein
MTPNSAQAATAAHLYEMAFARLVSDPDTKMRDLPSLWYGDFDVNNPTLVAYLGRERLTITYLRQAATFQGCRFEQDTADPNISGTGPDQPHEEQAAVLLGLDAREEIAQGRIASAMADANAAFVMARNIGQRSTLIQGLTGAGADGVACNALEAALPAVRSKAELAPLRLDDLPPLSSAIQQSLRGEEWFDLDRAVNATSPAGIKASQGQTPRLMSADAYPSAFVRVFEMNADPLVRFMRSIQDVSAQPYYKAQDKLSDLNEIGHTMGIANLLVPAMMNSLTAATRAETTESCARVGVAMTRYRLDHGTLPTTLDQLVPAYLDAVPIDPYDGNPLRLNTVDGASVIYSIGPDGMDNGGVPINERTGQGDIIFTLKPAIAGAATKP